MDKLAMTLVYTGAGTPSERRYDTPYELFRDAPELAGLLAMCGEEPARWPNGDSPDYDKLEALCRLLPLMPGHPLGERIRHLLAQGLGWQSEQTIPDPVALWQFLSAQLSPKTDDLTLARLAERMGAPFVRPDEAVTLCLPHDYRFCRPDPYHAAAYRADMAAGRDLPPEARDLLVSQQVRETAEACLADGRRLELMGTGAELERLTRYLSDSRRLPALVCVLTDPEAGDAPLSLPSGVRTALCLPGNASRSLLVRRLRACAERMPLLALVGIRLTVSCATDLGQVPIVYELLQKETFLN